MKRLLLFSLMVSVAGALAAQVQSNVPGAYANRAAAAVNTPAEVADRAAQVAAADPLIESQVSPETGEVMYYQRRICESTGQAYYDVLDFDQEVDNFIAIGWTAALDQASQVEPANEDKPACNSNKNDNQQEAETNQSSRRRTKRRRSSAVKLVSYHH